jgi:hypothetical protein
MIFDQLPYKTLHTGLSHRTSFGKITSEGRRPSASGRTSESADRRRTAPGRRPKRTAQADGPSGRPLADDPGGRPVLR